MLGRFEFEDGCLGWYPEIEPIVEDDDEIWVYLAETGDWVDAVVEALIESGDLENADIYPHDLFER